MYYVSLKIQVITFNSVGYLAMLALPAMKLLTKQLRWVYRKTFNRVLFHIQTSDPLSKSILARHGRQSGMNIPLTNYIPSFHQ